MEWLLLGLGALYVGAVGWFVMGRVDRFCHRGGIRPDWDAEEERRRIAAAPPAAAAPDYLDVS